MTIGETAELSGTVGSTVSRMETAPYYARPVVVRTLCAVYGVAPDETESLFPLAEDVRKAGGTSTAM